MEELNIRCDYDKDSQYVTYINEHLCYYGPLSSSSDTIQKFVENMIQEESTTDKTKEHLHDEQQESLD